MKVRQSVVSASSARPVATTAARSVFDMGAGVASNDDAPASQAAPSPNPSPVVVNAFGAAPRHTKEQPMATAAKRTRVTKAASAQFQILAALLGHGDLTRDELKAKVDADTKKFDQAIYNAKQN